MDTVFDRLKILVVCTSSAGISHGIWLDRWHMLKVYSSVWTRHSKCCKWVFLLIPTNFTLLVVDYGKFLYNLNKLCGRWFSWNRTTLYFELFTVDWNLLKLFKPLALFTFVLMAFFLLVANPDSALR
jgi:hypothetical protein